MRPRRGQVRHRRSALALRARAAEAPRRQCEGGEAAGNAGGAAGSPGALSVGFASESAARDARAGGWRRPLQRGANLGLASCALPSPAGGGGWLARRDSSTIARRRGPAPLGLPHSGRPPPPSTRFQQARGQRDSDRTGGFEGDIPTSRAPVARLAPCTAWAGHSPSQPAPLWIARAAIGR